MQGGTATPAFVADIEAAVPGFEMIDLPGRYQPAEGPLQRLHQIAVAVDAQDRISSGNREP
jgi:hypothetical protein